ncbi:hypothetical protein [Scytonema sp. NUACC26]|uniref:hypothetical protein n=1 Tax=Scytonema sp. NUACC26 TaxID=3140176 RepID=UPI0034DBE084
MNAIKAKPVTVPFGGIDLNGYVLPNGTYALSQSQVAEAIEVSPVYALRFLELKQLESSPGQDYTDYKIEVENNGQGKRGSTRIKIIPTKYAALFWMQQAIKGNVKAQALASAALEESLDTRFDKVLKIERLQEYYDAKLTSSADWFQSRQFLEDAHILFQTKCEAIRAYGGTAHDMLTMAITGLKASEHRMLDIAVPGEDESIGLNHISSTPTLRRIAYCKLMFARTKKGTVQERIKKAVSRTYRAGY